MSYVVGQKVRLSYIGDEPIKEIVITISDPGASTHQFSRRQLPLHGPMGIDEDGNEYEKLNTGKWSHYSSMNQNKLMFNEVPYCEEHKHFGHCPLCWSASCAAD